MKLIKKYPPLENLSFHDNVPIKNDPLVNIIKSPFSKNILYQTPYHYVHFAYSGLTYNFKKFYLFDKNHNELPATFYNDQIYRTEFPNDSSYHIQGLTLIENLIKNNINIYNISYIVSLEHKFEKWFGSDHVNTHIVYVYPLTNKNKNIIKQEINKLLKKLSSC